MRRYLPFLIIAIVILVAALSWWHFSASSDDSKGPPPGMGSVQVETMVVQAESLPSEFETVGSLRADESVMIRPEVVGMVRKIHFTEGSPVAAQSLLFSLDAELIRAELTEANANLENSRRGYQRANELAGKHLISNADLDTSRATLNVDQARAASANTKLRKTAIRAPFAGVVGLRDISEGDYVNVGQVLVELVRLDPIEIDLRVPEVILSSIALGQSVKVGVDSYRELAFVGTIVAIAPTVDAAARSVAIRARLPNPDGKLRPGMSARARIELGSRAEALLIPEQAVWPSGEQKMVYVLKDSIAHLLPVRLGIRVPGKVEVLSGIKAGDEIVTTGQLKLHDGAKATALGATAMTAVPVEAASQH